MIEKYLRMAAAGKHVLIVRDSAAQLHAHVNNGSLYIRSFSESGLRMVLVNVLVLVGDVPADIESLARERLSGWSETEVFREN